MSKDEIFSIWAPDSSPWSQWVKPVLFACLDQLPVEFLVAPPLADAAWNLSAGANAAIVVDAPGVDGVRLGLALARQGYRPVPLYNAIPAPGVHEGAATAVDLWPIAGALQSLAAPLAEMNLSDGAPPAFLLDGRRRGIGSILRPGDFDNRSVCFTTDFPSALFLASHGIERALLVQQGDSEPPQRDLAHVLRRWQEGGIQLQRVNLDLPGPPESFEVARPSWFGAMFQRVLEGLGFRRSLRGGFGAWVPDPSSGAG